MDRQKLHSETAQLLAAGYVYLSNGKMLNEEIIKAGYANVMTIPPNVKYQDRFLRAYKQARERKRDCGDIMWKLKYQSNNDGFTLIEVLIVIFIIIILAGILLPVLSRVRESGRKTQCTSNLRQISLGLIMYSSENNETFPTGATAMTALNTLYPDYVSERKAFMCPSDNLVTSATNAGITANDPFKKDECSYGYDRTHGPADASGVAIAGDRPTNAGGATTPTAGSNSPNHGGTIGTVAAGDTAGAGQNLVYIDGHVEWVATTGAGYADAAGLRDAVYFDNLAVTGGTDSYILQDGT